MNVIKRNKTRVPFDINRIHRICEFACEGLSGVSVSELELNAQLKFFDGITTKDIHNTLIRSAADLISADKPNYQFVASRLLMYKLRKLAYNQYEPWRVRDAYERGVKAGVYAPLVPEMTDEEWAAVDNMIDHTRDDLITYAGAEQWATKYLVRDKLSDQYYETPQIAYALIALTLLRHRGMRVVKRFYDACSGHVINLPTPILAGVRTPQRQFSSCTLIDVGDSLDSITAATAAIVNYAARRAGIGVNGGRIRAEGSSVGSGAVVHTGVYPIYRLLQAAVRSCSQGGVRNGAGTLYFPIWHREVEDIIVLKNNRGTEDTRLRLLDYGIQINKLFYRRLIDNGHITLFSPSEVPGLYDAFFQDQEKFEQLYVKYEKMNSIRKRTVSARDLFAAIMRERKETGRLYIMHVDHVNERGPFLPEKAPIYMSNLCAEIVLPTQPVTSAGEGEIALCTLAAINLSKINAPTDFEEPCELIVEALNALLDYQDYTHPAAARSTQLYRNLGVGWTSFAHFLVKRGISMQSPTDEDLRAVSEYAEAFAYYLTRASANWAARAGVTIDGFDRTCYSIGVFPWERGGRARPSGRWDWDALRQQIAATGIANATLTAQMPCETSSQATNSTNGIEPPRAPVSIKQSKDGALKQPVPDIKRYGAKYEYLWDQTSPIGYLKLVSQIQAWFDQSISTNTSYNPAHFPGGKIPMSTLLKDLLFAYNAGIKTLYYFNTADMSGEEDAQPADAPVACSVDAPESCDACSV